MHPRKHVFCYKIYHRMKYKLPRCCKEKITEEIMRVCIKIVFLSVAVILFFLSISL